MDINYCKLWHYVIWMTVWNQWRGNYFRTGGKPRAPKSGTRNKVLRWNWSVFCPKNKRSLKKEKKGLRRIRSVFLSQKWLRIEVSGGAKVAQERPKYLQGGSCPLLRGHPCPPTSRAYASNGKKTNWGRLNNEF